MVLIAPNHRAIFRRVRRSAYAAFASLRIFASTSDPIAPGGGNNAESCSRRRGSTAGSASSNSLGISPIQWPFLFSAQPRCEVHRSFSRKELLHFPVGLQRLDRMM